MNFLKGWKTRLFNAAALALLVLDAAIPLMQHEDVRAIIPAQYLPYYAVVVTVINLILREMTTGPAGRKASE